jgi:hypothetical protein
MNPHASTMVLKQASLGLLALAAVLDCQAAE